MKADQIRAKIQSVTPISANASEAVVGEIVTLDELGIPPVNAQPVQEEKEEIVEDLEYAISLLQQANDLLAYMANDKLTNVIEPVDRKEMGALGREIRVFLRVIGMEEAKDSQNMGNCKAFVRSSCVKAKVPRDRMCSTCKKWDLQTRMTKVGIIPDDTELTDRDVKVLETMQEALMNRGVDI